MKTIYPNKLKAGDEVRIVAPSRSLNIISTEIREIANKRLEGLGLKVTLSDNVEEIDSFGSSSIKSRMDDLHAAFSDPNVKAVISVIGGFNCNQLLRYIDWNIIKNNPKIFIGYSDTTALQNAIYTKTGLVTYSGPTYSTFGQELYFDYTLDYFKKCLFSEDSFMVEPSDSWSDDEWYANQKDRKLIKNEGWLVVNEGEMTGTIIGGNLSTLRLLYGTEYMPNIKNSILFIEEDNYTTNDVDEFDRNLQALIHQQDFNTVNGLVIGRFQNNSGMKQDQLIKIIKSKKELNGIPVLANVDFGHTSPTITFPIGGEVSIKVSSGGSEIEIVKH